MKMNRIFSMMDLQADINWIISELRAVKDPSVIQRFKDQLLSLKGGTGSISWNDISPEEQAEIEEGIRQADSGELIPHDEVMNDPKKWL